MRNTDPQAGTKWHQITPNGHQMKESEEEKVYESKLIHSVTEVALTRDQWNSGQITQQPNTQQTNAADKQTNKQTNKQFRRSPKKNVSQGNSVHIYLLMKGTVQFKNAVMLPEQKLNPYTNKQTNKCNNMMQRTQDIFGLLWTTQIPKIVTTTFFSYYSRFLSFSIFFLSPLK